MFWFRQETTTSLHSPYKIHLVNPNSARLLASATAAVKVISHRKIIARNMHGVYLAVHSMSANTMGMFSTVVQDCTSNNLWKSNKHEYHRLYWLWNIRLTSGSINATTTMSSLTIDLLLPCWLVHQIQLFYHMWVMALQSTDIRSE